MEAVSVVAELEGALLRDTDLFPYFMLVAFEASGLIRFTLLLLLWPLLRLLLATGRGELAIRVMALAAVAGVPVAEVEAVARAVLPKFFLDDLDTAAWPESPWLREATRCMDWTMRATASPPGCRDS